MTEPSSNWMLVRTQQTALYVFFSSIISITKTIFVFHRFREEKLREADCESSRHLHRDDLRHFADSGKNKIYKEDIKGHF